MGGSGTERHPGKRFPPHRARAIDGPGCRARVEPPARLVGPGLAGAQRAPPHARVDPPWRSQKLSSKSTTKDKPDNFSSPLDSYKPAGRRRWAKRASARPPRARPQRARQKVPSLLWHVCGATQREHGMGDRATVATIGWSRFNCFSSPSSLSSLQTRLNRRRQEAMHTRLLPTDRTSLRGWLCVALSGGIQG